LINVRASRKYEVKIVPGNERGGMAPSAPSVWYLVTTEGAWFAGPKLRGHGSLWPLCLGPGKNRGGPWHLQPLPGSAGY